MNARQRHPAAMPLILLAAMVCSAAGCSRNSSTPADEHAHETPQAHPDESGEQHVELSPEAIAAGGIESTIAGPREIEVRIEAPGEIRLNADRVVQVRPRFEGIVRRLPRELGAHVATGDVLAIVHSNESLAEYEITAPMAGTLVARTAAIGETVTRESVLFTLADLGTVWAYFPLYPQFATSVRTGQPVTVRSQGDDSLVVRSRVSYVGPLLEQDTRISYGRALLDNTSRRWTPGLYVTVGVTIERVQVRVGVPERAIVRTAAGPAVFFADSGRFVLRQVRTGRTDGEWTEIVEGMAPGDRYVHEQAFLLKAELGKSEAGHDH
jgi:cobalt-zinc-cadmium efflux system membrane fusion protein